MSRSRPPRRPGRPGARAPEEPAANLFGRNPVREALRAGRRPVHRVWATEGAAREPWLERSGVPVDITDAAALSALAGSDGHQGICALADPFPYAGAAELLARPRR